MLISLVKNLSYLFLLSFFFLLFSIIYIKYDFEAHFENKLDKNHEDYIKYHTTHWEKIDFHGFLFEEHKITTEDGYILAAWRIPGKISEMKRDIKKVKRAVILNHGLLDNSYTFMAHGESHSLPFILANNGFDVWLTNNRGTIFSSEHMDPNKNSSLIGSDYWDFTFHEMAKYDVIANINYVKKITKNEKINYICHSQGCTQFILGYTMNPEFFEKNVEKFGTMGAVLKYTHIKKLFPNLIKSLKIIEWLEYFGIKNVMSFDPIKVRAFGYLCHKALWICRYVISSIIQNEETNNITWESLSNMYYYQPGGSSTKNLMHWLQIIGAETIRHFDYGKEKNLKVYGIEQAPEYDLEKLRDFKIDIFITTTSGDPYCLKEDFYLMLNTFKHAKIYTKDVGKYNHLDYLWGKNAHEDIYQDMLNFLNDI